VTPSLPRHTRRPWTLWGLSLIIAALGIINVALALDHTLNAGHYRDLGVSYPPLLRAALALGWGAGLLACGWGLLRRQRWARRWLLVVVSNYAAFNVLWMVAFARSDFSRGRWAFQATLAVGLVAVLGWVMRWRRIRVAFEPPSPDAPASPVEQADATFGDDIYEQE